MNLSVLSTLNAEQFSCGMGEILKHGLIKDRGYFQWCTDHVDSIKARDYDALLSMVQKSCKIKRDVVEKDPTEQGERALLNFGHTLGHAIEKLKNFEMLHGQCVSVGCAAAAKLSCMKGLLSPEEFFYVEEGLKKFDLPIRITDLSEEDILKVTKSDKKMEAGRIKFILLKEIGNAYIEKNVTDEELLAAADYLLS